jgi:pilus assembly protein Flp/PilA
MKRFIADDSGATAIEYGLLAAMFALTILPFMPSFTQAFRDNYTTIANTMK